MAGSEHHTHGVGGETGEEWLRGRLTAHAGDLLVAPPNVQRIDARRRGIRRRRTSLAACAASAATAAAVVATVALTGGGGGGTAKALPGSTAVPGTSAPAATGSPETPADVAQPTDPLKVSIPPKDSTTSDGLGRATVATGEWAGHHWEFVRLRTHGEYDAPVGPTALGDLPTSGSTKRTGYCESFYVLVDGAVVNTAGGGGCGEQPHFVRGVPGSAVNTGSLRVVVPPTGPGRPGGPAIGTIVFAVVETGATSGTASFSDGGKAPVVLKQVPATDGQLAVLAVPAADGHNGSVRVTIADGAGKTLVDLPDMGVGGSAK
ncbi:hypothetical protein [Yinghuangia seranimata]|uniref:hypothetical protein n=1 Tax=Yinghuangia seranimata TaxID=408067 RepID=UPI00248B4B2A|nr:hypothetical protein [Yinghuangia seranimata]MDI2125207.1 hypothetical protein [Yinghuangia seranimata]